MIKPLRKALILFAVLIFTYICMEFRIIRNKQTFTGPNNIHQGLGPAGPEVNLNMSQAQHVPKLEAELNHGQQLNPWFIALFIVIVLCLLLGSIIIFIVVKSKSTTSGSPGNNRTGYSRDSVEESGDAGRSVLDTGY